MTPDLIISLPATYRCLNSGCFSASGSTVNSWMKTRQHACLVVGWSFITKQAIADRSKNASMNEAIA